MRAKCLAQDCADPAGAPAPLQPRALARGRDDSGPREVAGLRATACSPKRGPTRLAQAVEIQKDFPRAQSRMEAPTPFGSSAP
eukprot:747879-Pyramimonas_sp.AAC.1